MCRDLMGKRRFVVLLLSAVLSSSVVCFAQVDRSDISGTVTDSAGTILPQVHVTAVNQATGLRRQTD
jgi:hypothetical protein